MYLIIKMNILDSSNMISLIYDILFLAILYAKSKYFNFIGFYIFTHIFYTFHLLGSLLRTKPYLIIFFC